MTYVAPALLESEIAPKYEENGYILLLIAVVLALYGGAWAFCQATCGWGRVASCETKWPYVKVVCK